MKVGDLVKLNYEWAEDIALLLEIDPERVLLANRVGAVPAECLIQWIGDFDPEEQFVWFSKSDLKVVIDEKQGDE